MRFQGTERSLSNDSIRVYENPYETAKDSWKAKPQASALSAASLEAFSNLPAINSNRGKSEVNLASLVGHHKVNQMSSEVLGEQKGNRGFSSALKDGESDLPSILYNDSGFSSIKIRPFGPKGKVLVQQDRR